VRAFATTLSDRLDRASPLRRPAIFLFVASLHVVLLLVAARWVTTVDRRGEESLLFLRLPSQGPIPAEILPTPLPPRKKQPVPAHETQLVVVPTPAQAPAESPPRIIDWHAEAERTAKRQAELATAPRPRDLNRHGAGTDFDGGLGPEGGSGAEFGWDHARIHRFEPMEGGGYILWINDRCFIVIAAAIPFPMCGVGKIPVRGDLFDHMRDLRRSEPTPNTAP
jgi:hypothetical protein